MIETVSAPAPIEVVSPIRPSEAIRLGCLIKPVQTFARDYVDEVGACAVGAGTLGMGWDPYGVGPGDFEDLVEDVLPEGCPVEGCTQGAYLVHLNDTHYWTRERIADWLEGMGL